jgi:uncharacterized protein (TIGR00255 family)
MTNSMTGFAAAKGESGGWNWAWDIRSVNARGLDIRMRLPDWIEGLEPALRPMIQKALARGNVSLSLKVQTEGSDVGGTLNATALSQALSMLAEVEHEAQSRGISLTPATPADLLNLRGVIDTASSDRDTGPLRDALVAELPGLLQAFNAMRAAEGAMLEEVLRDQVDQIETLTEAATKEAVNRREEMAASFRANLARILENADGADPDRVAQELAVIAVKTDITEELDRLRAHVKAARDLLATKEPVGRKLDFLTQEFNREANTLCSKAQSAELTRIGLDLKHVIDQMREQVQNVE